MKKQYRFHFQLAAKFSVMRRFLLENRFEYTGNSKIMIFGVTRLQRLLPFRQSHSSYFVGMLADPRFCP